MDSMYGRSTGNKGKRWVCPNDRQLALRAKLRTGWSVKSESFESRYADFTYTPSSSSAGNLNSSSSSSTSYALTDEERSAIVQVIKRAEALDVSEQERVGRLVERLENMKRNVHTVTTARSSNRTCGSRCSGSNGCVCSCALCGEKFTVLGAGPALCHDCRKYICQKCGIETSPSYATPSGSSASSTSTSSTTPQHHPSIVSLHLRLKSSTSRDNKWFLCRICAETREMWKKSGAWFFKGLPKYVLPEKKDRGRSRTGSRSLGWTTAGGTRSLEPPEHDSSSDDDAGRRMPRTRSLLSANSDVDAAHREGSTTPLGAPHLGVRSCSSGSVERRLSNENTVENSENANNRRSSSTSSTTMRSKGGLGANGQRGRRSTIGDERKCEHLTTDNAGVSQVHRRSASTLSMNNSSRRGSSTAVSAASSSSSVSSLRDHHHCERNRDHEMRNHNSHEHMPRTNRKGSGEAPQSYGTVEISLRYDPGRQCLQCKILRARSLRPMDLQGLSDPFCKLNILPLTSTATKKYQRTKTVHRTRDPEFNEQLDFYEITEIDMKSSRALHVLILQDDPVGRDFLGEARFPLYEVPPYQTRFYNVFLEERYQVQQEETAWGSDGTNGRGQIRLSLSYSTRRCALLVTVERATNLLAMDSNGFSDPFVKLCLAKEKPTEASSTSQRYGSFGQIVKSKDKSHGKKHTKKKKSSCNTLSTSVKWKTLNPEWNEEFIFETPLTDLEDLALYMWVWDKDLGKTNDYLGGLTLSCNSKGGRLRHWIDAIKYPDRSHQATHNLIEDLMSTD